MSDEIRYPPARADAQAKDNTPLRHWASLLWIAGTVAIFGMISGIRKTITHVPNTAVPPEKQVSDPELKSVAETHTATAELVIERHEIHEWNRLLTQTYFTWYTVFLVFNGAALIALVTAQTALGVTTLFVADLVNPTFLKPLCVVFACWNAFGVAATIGVFLSNCAVYKRLRQIKNDILPMRVAEDGDSSRAAIADPPHTKVWSGLLFVLNRDAGLDRRRIPIPTRLWNLAFILNAAALGLLMYLWITLYNSLLVGGSHT